MTTITKYSADGSSLSVEIDDNDIEGIKELIEAIRADPYAVSIERTYDPLPDELTLRPLDKADRPLGELAKACQERDRLAVELADARRDLEASKSVQRDLNEKLADERLKNEELVDALRKAARDIEKMQMASLGDASAWKGDDPNPVGVILKHGERVATVAAIDFGRKPMAYLEGFRAKRDYRIECDEITKTDPKSPYAAPPLNPYQKKKAEGNHEHWADGWRDAGKYPIDDIPDPSPWFA